MADTGLLVRHVKTTLEGLENPARRQGCSAAAAGALGARANSDSGREEHRGLQRAGSAGRQRGALRKEAALTCTGCI